MKDNSYVATGYKYGLLDNPGISGLKFRIDECIGKGYDYNYNGERVEPKIAMETNDKFHSEAIIPFEDIDGLSIEELDSHPSLLYDGTYYVFVMYDLVQMCDTDRSSYFTKFKEQIPVAIARYILTINTAEVLKGATIDEIVEKQLVSNIGKMRLSNRRRALGFLEKYIYTDKERTDSAIQEYLEKKQDRSIRPYAKEYIKIPDRLIKRENSYN